MTALAICQVIGLVSSGVAIAFATIARRRANRAREIYEHLTAQHTTPGGTHGLN